MKIDLYKNFDMLVELTNIFKDNIFCGSVIDFIEIDWQEVKDIDFLIEKTHFLNVDLANLKLIDKTFKFYICKAHKNTLSSYKVFYKNVSIDIYVESKIDKNDWYEENNLKFTNHNHRHKVLNQILPKRKINKYKIISKKINNYLIKYPNLSY